MKRNYNKNLLQFSSVKMPGGFSLIEMITVLVITSMLIIATMNIYSSVKTAAASINEQLDRNALPADILQRIAEDLDKLAAPGFDTTILVKNKFDAGYNISRLVIKNNIYDKDKKAQVFEKVIWQTSYDPFEDALMLYRLHGGLNLEEKMLTDAKQREMRERGDEIFVPLCSGITYFKIEIPRGEDDFLDNWENKNLPRAVTITISFAEPFETLTGELDVYDEDKTVRTIAIDRTRKIKYSFVPRELLAEDYEPIDPNNIMEDDMDPNEVFEDIIEEDRITEENRINEENSEEKSVPLDNEG